MSEGDSQITSQLKNDPSPAIQAKLERKLLIQKLLQLDSQAESSLPLVNLPTKCSIVILQGFGDWIKYSGDIVFNKQSEKLTVDTTMNPNTLIINVFYNEPQEAADPKAKKTAGAEPLQFIINEQPVEQPILQAIIQQLCVEFMQREIFIHTLKESKVWNLSGQSIQLCVYPTVYTTPHDQQLVQLYDTNQSLRQLKINYDTFIQQCKEDENKIPVILGAMIDSVILQESRGLVQKNQFTQQILLPERELLYTLQSQQQITQFPPQYNYTSSINVLDTFTYSGIQYQTTLGKHYFERCVNAILFNIQNHMNIFENTIDLMSQKAQFSELVRMFMNQLSADVSIAEAEDIIRKTILLHMHQKPDSFCVDIIDKLTEEQIKSFDIEKHQIVKLGSMQNQEMNLLSVYSQALSNPDMPVSNKYSYDPMTATYMITSELEEGIGNVVQQPYRDEIQVKFVLENEINRILKILGMQQKYSPFQQYAPNYGQFIQILIDNLKVIKQNDIGASPSKGGKSARGASEMTTEIHLNFDNDFNSEDISQIFQSVNIDPKKAKGPIQSFFNPFIPSIENDWLKVLHCAMHQKLFPKKEPKQEQQEEIKEIITEPEIKEQQSEQVEQNEPQNNQLDAPSVSISAISLEDQIERQTDKDLIDKYEQGIYYNAKTLLGNGETSLCNMIGKFAVIKRSLPEIKEVQQQVDPKAAGKDKKVADEPGTFPEFSTFLDIDPHLGVACFLAQQQGDERNIYIFNRLLQIIYGKENSFEKPKMKPHCEICAKQGEDAEKCENQPEEGEKQVEDKTEQEDILDTLDETDSNPVSKYFERIKPIIFCKPCEQTGASADGIEFLGKKFELQLKDLLIKINEKQAGLNQIDIYKQSGFKGVKYENITKEYQINQSRQYGDYYVHISDKSILKALPSKMQLRLSRQFCGLNNYLPGITNSQMFCDKLIFKDYLEIPNEPISTRPMSANTAAQKGGKGAKPEDLVEIHVPQKLIDIPVKRMVLSEPDNLNIKYPTKGKITGTFQDGWQIRAVDELLVLSNDYVSIQFDHMEQSFELQGDNCQIKFFNGQLSLKYDNNNVMYDVIEKKKEQVVEQMQEANAETEQQEKKEDDEQLEQNQEDDQQVSQNTQEQEDKKVDAQNESNKDRLPNFYSAIATLVENKLLVLTDFQNLEMSQVDDEVSKQVEVKCDIDDIKCYGNQLNVINFTAKLLPFSSELAQYIAFELGSVSTVAICDKQQARILVIHGLGDIFYTNLQEQYTQILKQDGTTLQFFTVEAIGTTFYDLCSKNQQETQQEDMAASKAPAKKGKEEPVVQEQPQQKIIYRSPLILYAGCGYTFWNSILEKKSRYNRHNTVGSRVNFDLERKLNPTLCNPESRKSFDMQDVFEALCIQKQETQKQYAELMSFGLDTQKKTKGEYSLQRLHHEMFIPMSDTEISCLQGVYRILLGQTNVVDSPLYPSISIYDWSGNTSHVRLGAPLESEINVRVLETVPPDPAAKKGAPEQVLVQKTLLAPDIAPPTLPPVDSASVQSDVTSQIENLIAERQAAAEGFAEKLRTFKLDKEAMKDRPPSPEKGKGKPAKGKAEPTEEVEVEPQIEQISQRNLKEILSELKDIEVATPFQQLISKLAGEEKAQMGKRQEKCILDNHQLTQFIREKINAQMPSPARRAFGKKTILVPAAPVKENVNQRFKTLIEADLPWVVLEVEDLKWIEYIAQLHGFADTPSLKLNLTPETFNLRFYAPFQAYGCPSVPKFIIQLQAVMQQITKQTLKASCGYLHVLKACSPIFKIQQTEYQNPEPEQYFFNQYLNIYNYANPEIINIWAEYEEVKTVYRDILSKRHQKIQEPRKSQNTLMSNIDLLREVEEYVANAKIVYQKEKERQLQRQKEIELEKQLHEQKLLQQEKMKQQQQNLTSEDYSIDKPLGKKNNKQNSPTKNQITKQKQLSIQYDDIDSEDEDLDRNMLKSDRYLKKFPVLTGIENQALPKVLPLFKKQKGQSVNNLIKVVPDRINGRAEKSVLVIKSLSQEPIEINIEYEKQYIDLPQTEYTMNPYEQKRVFIKHVRFGDSRIVINAKQGEHTMQSVIKIIQ